jgi:hydrogenase-1 operon protein HyaF
MTASPGTARALESIGVTVEHSSGNVLPLLHEIRHALALLMECNAPTTLDLQRIPLAPGEEAHILQDLGEGEARAELNALGRSEFVETALPGVWIVTHYDSDEQRIARFIEIARVPAMLCAQREDIQRALNRLTARLAPNRRVD